MQSTLSYVKHRDTQDAALKYLYFDRYKNKENSNKVSLKKIKQKNKKDKRKKARIFF